MKRRFLKTRDMIDAAVIRLRFETQIPITVLAREPMLMPSGREVRPSAQTLLRWGTEGAGTASGRVYLDLAFRRGAATWFTSREAVDRFLRELADRQRAEMIAGRESLQPAAA